MYGVKVALNARRMAIEAAHHCTDNTVRWMSNVCVGALVECVHTHDAAGINQGLALSYGQSTYGPRCCIKLGALHLRAPLLH